MSDYELINGDCLEVLPTLERETIDLVVTSPPYDNLRNYRIVAERKKRSSGG